MSEKRVVAERLTVGLIPKVVADMAALQSLHGLSKTDIINRAITLYRFVSDQFATGNELLVRNAKTGELEKVHLL